MTNFQTPCYHALDPLTRPEEAVPTPATMALSAATTVALERYQNFPRHAIHSTVPSPMISRATLARIGSQTTPSAVTPNKSRDNDTQKPPARLTRKADPNAKSTATSLYAKAIDFVGTGSDHNATSSMGLEVTTTSADTEAARNSTEADVARIAAAVLPTNSTDTTGAFATHSPNDNSNEVHHGDVTATGKSQYSIPFRVTTTNAVTLQSAQQPMQDVSGSLPTVITRNTGASVITTVGSEGIDLTLSDDDADDDDCGQKRKHDQDVDSDMECVPIPDDEDDDDDEEDLAATEQALLSKDPIYDEGRKDEQAAKRLMLDESAGDSSHQSTSKRAKIGGKDSSSLSVQDDASTMEKAVKAMPEKRNTKTPCPICFEELPSSVMGFNWSTDVHIRNASEMTPEQVRAARARNAKIRYALQNHYSQKHNHFPFWNLYNKQESKTEEGPHVAVSVSSIIHKVYQVVGEELPFDRYCNPNQHQRPEPSDVEMVFLCVLVQPLRISIKWEVR
jgi:hypothetical protein